MLFFRKIWEIPIVELHTGRLQRILLMKEQNWMKLESTLLDADMRSLWMLSAFGSARSLVFMAGCCVLVLTVVYITTKKSVTSICLQHETNAFYYAWQSSRFVMSDNMKCWAKVGITVATKENICLGNFRCF